MTFVNDRTPIGARRSPVFGIIKMTFKVYTHSLKENEERIIELLDDK